MTGTGAEGADLGVLIDERRQLINLAYRMLGSLADAEDVVQETYARWYAMSPQEQSAIRAPGAWLTTVASRICLNQLTSARARRETYVGEWLPEPLPSGTAVDPAERVTLDESVHMAFLVVLESMTPAERVAFILHDVFRYPFNDIADIVGRSPAACRQLASSARRRVRETQTPASTAQSARIVRDFKHAWEVKDIDTLIGLLDPDATAIADGGGAAGAVLHPITGAAQIVRSLLQLEAKLNALTLLERTVNGCPGLIARHDGRTVSVYAFNIRGPRIERIWAMRNPDKLHLWT